MKPTTVLIVIAAFVAATPLPPATAGECGLSCCIAAGQDGIPSHVGASGALQYESMRMETNRRGTDEVDPSDIIAAELADRTGMFAVSTRMTMQKVAANLVYRLGERNTFVATVPYVINDMDMRMGRKMMPSDPVTTMDMSMDTVRGVGDVSVLYLRDVYEDVVIRTRKRISIGVGAKLPTGDDGARRPNGLLVHMMMQAGTGSIDGLLVANGAMGFGMHPDGGARVVVSPALAYQINTRNDLGYKVGDHLDYDLSTRYRLTSKLNLRLDLNGVWSARDDTDGTLDPDGPVTMGMQPVAYQAVTGNVLDNVANTGLHSLFVSPGFQWIATTRVVVSGEWRLPVYQDVRGVQQVTDHWIRVRASVRF